MDYRVEKIKNKTNHFEWKDTSILRKLNEDNGFRLDGLTANRKQY